VKKYRLRAEGELERDRVAWPQPRRRLFIR
jgi:hypothetical protein